MKKVKITYTASVSYEWIGEWEDQDYQEYLHKVDHENDDDDYFRNIAETYDGAEDERDINIESVEVELK